MSKLPDLMTDGIRALRGEFDDEVMRLEAEVKRLRECMRLAGLQAFMHDKNPEEIASHLKYVMDSYVDHEKKLEAEVKRLRKERDRLRDEASWLEDTLKNIRNWILKAHRRGDNRDLIHSGVTLRCREALAGREYKLR